MTAFETLFKNDARPVLNEMLGAEVCVVRNGETSDRFTARRLQLRIDVFGTVTNSAMTIREYYLPKESYVIKGWQTVPMPGDIIYDGDDQWVVFVPDNGSDVAESVRQHEWRCQTRKQ